LLDRESLALVEEEKGGRIIHGGLQMTGGNVREARTSGTHHGGALAIINRNVIELLNL